MKTLIKIMTAATLVATSGIPIAAPADGATRHHHYYGRTAYRHKVCRRSSGTTGLVAGGVGGAVIGSQVIGGGILGTAAGAVGGALAGRAIDRASTSHRRCYYTR
jgi:uncharacterized protein YcfJ